MKKPPPQKTASKPYLEKVQDAHNDFTRLIDDIERMAKNAREGLSENYFWECDGETGASLWSIFDTIWVTLMDKKEPISTELFEKYPIVEREID